MKIGKKETSEQYNYEVGHEKEQKIKIRILSLILLVLGALSIYGTYVWMSALLEGERPFMIMGIPTMADSYPGTAITISIKSTCNYPLIISCIKLKNGSEDLELTKLSCKEIAPGELIQVTAFSDRRLDGKSYEARLIINGKEYPFTVRRAG